jgi:hypothetical protein
MADIQAQWLGLFHLRVRFWHLAVISNAAANVRYYSDLSSWPLLI